jgi:hypothetical protein
MIKMIGPAPICLQCKHYNNDLTCKAFPNGILDEIIMDGNDHLEPIKGDNGIQFEQADDSKEISKKSIGEVEWRREFDIEKTDEDQRLVFGWLSVAKDENGNSILDLQDDVIDPEDLEKAAITYALESREAGQSHIKTTGIGKMVMSIVTTKEIQKAMGIPKGIVPEGWFIGYKIIDDETWDLVKSGDYKGFSIGGTGKRVPYYV